MIYSNLFIPKCGKIANRPLSIYASIPVNNNLKLRFHAKFSCINCIFPHEASTSCYCSRELKRNSKVATKLTNLQKIRKVHKR